MLQETRYIIHRHAVITHPLPLGKSMVLCQNRRIPKLRHCSLTGSIYAGVWKGIAKTLSFT